MEIYVDIIDFIFIITGLAIYVLSENKTFEKIGLMWIFVGIVDAIIK